MSVWAVHRRLAFASHHESRDMLADLLDAPPDCLTGVDVHEALEWCSGVGPELADAWQTAARIFSAVAIGELGARRRGALCALLRFRPPRAARTETEAAA